LKPLEKIPAIIFVVGSKESSYRTNYKSFSKFFMEDLIEEQNIALVHFDKRGIGKSTGKWYKTSLEHLAEDVKEVAKFLSKIEYIDTSKIYVIGHSQGGWIVQYC
jgi:pimeloyl-ACP methyl ester carboxylesterase